MEKWRTWGKVTDASDVDPDFASQIASIPCGDRLFRCIQCGTCSEACLSGVMTQNLFTSKQMFRETEGMLAYV